MRPPRPTTLLCYLLALTAAAAAWFYLAPAAIGGATTYVVTSGVSMEPHFHSGDLALVRRQGSYRVGEIVAYQNTMLHTVVLHRIIGREGSTYLFKGDNNDFVDPDHPQRRQLIGALWLHVAGAGRVLESLRSPLAVGGLVGVGTLLLFGGALTQRRRRRRRHRRSESGSISALPRRSSRARPQASGLIAAGIVALLPFAVLSLPAFTRAATSRLPVRIAYRQSGEFSYAGAAQPGPVYPGNRVLTGAPLFTRVVSAVEFRFRYGFETAGTHSITGKVGLYATVSSTNGWQRTLTLETPATFRGDHAVAAARLDLRSLTQLLAAVEKATSVSGQYTLTLIPRVSVTGSVDDTPLHLIYAPTLPFTLSQFELQRAGPVASGTFGGPAASTPLDPSATGSVTDPRAAKRYIPLAFTRVPVASARLIAIAGVAAVLAVLGLALVLIRRRHPDESTTIRARYGHAIVDVARVKRRRRLALVDVADMEALAQIAERYDRLILHERNVDGEAFWVADESAQYRYVTAATSRQATSSRPADRHAFRRWRRGAHAHPGTPAGQSAHVTANLR